MYKKVVTCTIVVLFITAGFIGCGGTKGGKYGDVKTLMDDMTGAMDGLTSSLGKAGNAKDCADSLNKFTGKMKKLQPQMFALEKKYPEMKNKKDPPAELKAEMKKLEEASKKMIPAFMKIAKFQKDPAVMKAMKDMSTAMMPKKK